MTDACALCDGDAPKTARDACAACGRAACAEHFRALLGLCKGCATDERVARAREGEKPPPLRERLGIKWVDE